MYFTLFLVRSIDINESITEIQMNEGMCLSKRIKVSYKNNASEILKAL